MHLLIHTKQSLLKQKVEKKKVFNDVDQLDNKYFDIHKKNYDSEKVKDEEKRERDYKQFETIDNTGQEPKSTKNKKTKTKKSLMKCKHHHGLNQIKMILTH